jgi:hypothetical protein
MQIRKIYQEINPTLLYDEIKEYAQNQGLNPDQSKMETYSMPSDSSRFIYRGTLTFRSQGKEALRAHIMGTDKADTKLMLDSDDALFSPARMAAMEKDLDFLLGSYESPK